MNNDDGGLRKRRRPDPSLPRTTVRDTSISFRALGALLWIMDKPDGWSIRADQMAKDGKRPDGTNSDGRQHRREGREAIRTALLEELAAEGLYRLERRRMLDGSVKMGTAASEDRVDSWMRQYEIFGRKPVPMVQQPDGSFLVQYPDGSLGPDDCDPPEMPDFSPVDTSDQETAGQTGAQKPVSGAVESDPPVPRKPAPVKPASGKPASGNPSPLSTSKKEKVLREKENPPTPRGDDAAASSDDEAETRGGDISEEDKQLFQAGLDKALQLRPGWQQRDVRTVMWRAIRDGRSPRDVGIAIAVAAADAETVLPHRILSDLWWVDSMPQVLDRAPASRPCQEPGHLNWPAHNCAACKVDKQQAAADERRAAKEAAELAAAVRSAELAVAESEGVEAPESARRAASRPAGRLNGRIRV